MRKYFIPIIFAALISTVSFPTMQAFAGTAQVSCPNVIPSPTTLFDLIDQQGSIQVDDKCFTQFFTEGEPEQLAQIQVEGVIVEGEKGLRFTDMGEVLRTTTGSVIIMGTYNVISFGTPIIDNTLTLNDWEVAEFSADTAQVSVDETVLDLGGNILAEKFVFARVNSDFLEDHAEFAPQQSVIVNTEVRFVVAPFGEVAHLKQWTQTFSQEPEPQVAGQLLPLDNTALFLAGIQSMTVWMIPTILGLAGAGVYLVKYRKQ